MMNIMIGRNLLICFGLLLVSMAARAQGSEPDKSPMDISYAPHNYPILKFQGKSTSSMPFARVVYSRPQKNGRTLFGNEIKYNEIWRLGANESTEIEFFRSATIAGKTIPKGRYTLFCIPTPDKWTLVLSKDNFTWGAFSYKPSNDFTRFSVAVSKVTSPPVEYFTMYFNESNHLVIIWDDLKVVAPIVFSTAK
jgi:Protein of unknown function (DUF2911)